MKKYLILLFCLFATILSAFAGTVYYVSKTGEILQIGTNTKISKNMNSNLTCYTFSFTYGKDKYYMVKENDSKYSRKSLLGCENYSITNMFDPLVMLNSDNILEKLTSDELRKANIRFVKLKSTIGNLDLPNRNHDFNLDKIAYIDLSKMTYNTKENGEVTMYMKPKNEDLYYSSNGYMKDIVITIQAKSKQQADRMF
ncbi:MAG: hypothetical protein IKR34_04980 [Candidatus Gastranaerophilales bacterium]|nr:hypothetical protein [Candidatus Gastranaerophilales bacterium]